MAETFDTPLPQVLVHYPDDPGGFFYHHRVLLKRVRGSMWATFTPTLELQRHDLLEISHRVLDRRAPFPADVRDQCFVFDDLPHAALVPYKKRATIQASILGEEGDAADVERMVWVVAETSSDVFGTIVEDDAMDDPELGVYFESKWGHQVQQH